MCSIRRISRGMFLIFHDFDFVLFISFLGVLGCRSNGVTYVTGVFLCYFQLRPP